MSNLVNSARSLLPAAIELRRSIQAEPELGLDLPRTTSKVLQALQGLPLDIGQGRRATSITMAAEDFSYVLEQVPGAMASLGTRPPEFGEGEAPNAHSNRCLLHEDAMAAGVAMYAGVALAYLRPV